MPPKGFPFYSGPKEPGERIEAPKEPITFESLSRRSLDDPGRYRPHPDLEAAVNTALLLGLPLLVTGEPGSGKTQLGEAVAHALGLRHEKFETKSNSQARDAFYVFDVIGRFHAKDAKLDAPEADPRFFIEYTALGKAILMAYPRSDVAHLLPTGPHNFAHTGEPVRSVVVIDELDKASRDFPNDILNEIERMYFRIPELGAIGVRGTPGAEDASRQIASHLRPVLIFTSNSEKKLPDAFLRRCVYFHVPEPGRAELLEIVEARLNDLLKQGQPLVSDALDFYIYVRDPRRSLSKKPGTAELLNWLQALIGRGADPQVTLREQREVGLAALSALFKTSEDLTRAAHGSHGQMAGLFLQWAQGQM